eukprot:2734819-Rhodomonas_salina.1
MPSLRPLPAAASCLLDSEALRLRLAGDHSDRSDSHSDPPPSRRARWPSGRSHGSPESELRVRSLSPGTAAASNSESEPVTVTQARHGQTLRLQVDTGNCGHWQWEPGAASLPVSAARASLLVRQLSE